LLERHAGGRESGRITRSGVAALRFAEHLAGSAPPIPERPARAAFSNAKSGSSEHGGGGFLGLARWNLPGASPLEVANLLLLGALPRCSPDGLPQKRISATPELRLM
jgi:hypothetical protein